MTYNSANRVNSQYHFDKIPELLRKQNRWVTWRRELVNDNPTKVPYNPNAERHDPSTFKANCNDPRTWSSFDKALSQYKSMAELDGIGIMTDGKLFTGVDIDDCFIDGKLSEDASRIIAECNSYTEKSPSGKGIRIFLLGELPGGAKRNKIEIYGNKRYLTVTGNHIDGTPSTVEPRQAVIDRIFAALKPPPKNEKTTFSKGECSLQDEKVLSLAKQDPAFAKLYAGDFSGIDYKADGITPDYSRADGAACFILARYTRDAGQIDRIIRSSALYRDKWDREDYKQRTIQGALEAVSLDSTTVFCELEKEVENLITPVDIIKPVDAGTVKPVEPAKKEKESIRIMTRSALRSQKRPEWLIHDHLIEKSLGVAYGAYGACKSFYALEMALCIANGLPFFERYKARKGKACYVAAEGSFGIAKRVDAWEKIRQAGASTPDDSFALIPDSFDFLDETFPLKIATLIAKHFYGPIDLLVLDTLARLFGSGDENSTRDMNRFINNAAKLQNMLQCNVLILHHIGKDLSKKFRGAYALGAALDYAIELKGDPRKDIRVRCEKQKDFGPFGGYVLEADKVPLVGEDSLVLRWVGTEAERGEADAQEEDDKTLYSVLRHLERGQDRAKQIKELDVSPLSQATAYRLINHALNRDLVLRVGTARPFSYCLSEEGSKLVNHHRAMELVG